MTTRPDQDIRSILVINVARIGDTLLATPAIRALKERYPSAHLTVLAHPKRKEVLENLPFIDCLGGITPKMARWRGWLPGTRYDLAVVYGKDLPLVRYALRVARQAVTVGWKGLSAGDDRLTIVPPLPAGSSMHAVHERARVVDALGAPMGLRRLAYQVTLSERQAAEKWLLDKGASGMKPLVGLQICSFPTKAHRDWPLDSFRTFMAAMLDKQPECGFLILGDDKAREAATPLVDSFPGRVVVAAGSTTLRQTAALIDRLDLYVGVDTGPTHIAGALDVPMVAMYHADYPGRNLTPLDRPACVMLEHPLTGKIEPGKADMKDVQVDDVLDAVSRILA